MFAGTAKPFINTNICVDFGILLFDFLHFSCVCELHYFEYSSTKNLNFYTNYEQQNSPPNVV